MVYGNKFYGYGMNENSSLYCPGAIELLENDFSIIDEMLSVIVEGKGLETFIKTYKGILNKFLETIAKLIASLGKLIGKVFPKFKSFLQDIENEILSKTGGDFSVEISYYRINDEPLKRWLNMFKKILNFDHDAINYIKSTNKDEFINHMKNSEEIDEMIDKIASEKESFKKEYFEKIETTITFNSKSSEFKEIIKDMEEIIEDNLQTNKLAFTQINDIKDNISNAEKFFDGSKDEQIDTSMEQALRKLISIERFEIGMHYFIIDINQTELDALIPTLKKLIHASKSEIKIPEELENFNKKEDK